MEIKTKNIATLNDYVRTKCMKQVFNRYEIPCKFLITQGVAALGPIAQIEISTMVRDYDDFTAGNDPYGERDFGAFTYEGEKIFWKIDYYDKHDAARGSEDPADPEQTLRVLTIMLADEY